MNTKNLKNKFFILIIIYFVVFAALLFLSYVDHKKELNQFKAEFKNFLIEKNKKILEYRVNNIISIIKTLEKNDVFSEKLLKEIVDSMIFENNTYVFILKIINLNKDKFATMLVNPNRKDIEGKVLSASYKDIKGKEFRKEFIKKIKLYGQGFVKYHYTKMNGIVGEKISLFKRYKNYIIASGFYISSIDKDTNLLLQKLKIILLKSTINIFIAFFISIILLIIITYLIISSIEKEIEKNIKYFNETNKLQINEIISNIAHKFRQPLNVISTKLIKTQLLLETDNIKEAKEIITSIEKELLSLSDEINNFQSIVDTNPCVNFSLKEAINEVLELVHKDTIKININIKKDYTWNFNKENFKRFLFLLFINVLKNAKSIEIELEKEITIKAQMITQPTFEQLNFLKKFFKEMNGFMEYEIKEKELIIKLKKCPT